MQRRVVMALVWLFGLGGLGVWFPFISLYLDENLGLSGIQLGMAIAGLVANPEAGLSEPGLEIMFPVAGATLERVGARGLLAIGVIAGGVRWIVCGLASDLAWVYPVAVLHGVVVMGLVIGGPLQVDPGRAPAFALDGPGAAPPRCYAGCWSR